LILWTDRIHSRHDFCLTLSSFPLPRPTEYEMMWNIGVQNLSCTLILPVKIKPNQQCCLVPRQFFAGQFFTGQFFVGQFFVGQFFAWTVLRWTVLRLGNFSLNFFSSKADNSSPDDSSPDDSSPDDSSPDDSSPGQFFVGFFARTSVRRNSGYFQPLNKLNLF
jgi:hypothetical protein